MKWGKLTQIWGVLKGGGKWGSKMGEIDPNLGFLKGGGSGNGGNRPKFGVILGGG